MSPLALKQKQRRARKQRVPLSLKLDCVRGTSPQLPIFFQETRPQAEGASPAAALPERRTPPRPWPGRSTCGTSYLSPPPRRRNIRRGRGRVPQAARHSAQTHGTPPAAVLGAHAGGAAAADASLTPSASVQSSVRFVLAGSRLAGGWPCRRARRPGSGRYPSQLPSGWTVFHLPSTPWVRDIHPICIQRTEYI